MASAFGMFKNALFGSSQQQRKTFIKDEIDPHIVDSHVKDAHILIGEVMDNSLQAVFTHYMSSFGSSSSSSPGCPKMKYVVQLTHIKENGDEKLIFYDNGTGMTEKDLIITRKFGKSKASFDFNRINYFAKVGRYGVGKNALLALAKKYKFETLNEAETKVAVAERGIEEVEDEQALGHDFSTRDKEESEPTHFTKITLFELRKRADKQSNYLTGYQNILAEKYTLMLKKYELPDRVKEFLFQSNFVLPDITFKIIIQNHDTSENQEIELNHIKANVVMKSLEMINGLNENEKFFHQLQDTKSTFGLIYAGYFKNALSEGKFIQKEYPSHKKGIVFVNGIYLADVNLDSIIKIHPSLKLQYQNLRAIIFIQAKPGDSRFDMDVHKQGFKNDGWVQEYKQSGSCRTMNDMLKKFVERSSQGEHWHFFGPQENGERSSYSCPENGCKGGNIIEITVAKMIRIPLKSNNAKNKKFRTYKVTSIKAKGPEDYSMDKDGYIELQDELFPMKFIKVNALKDCFEAVTGPDHRKSYKKLILPNNIIKKSGLESVEEGSDIKFEFDIRTETNAAVDFETLQEYYDFSISDEHDKMKYSTNSATLRGLIDPSKSYVDGTITFQAKINLLPGTYKITAELIPKYQDEYSEDATLKADKINTLFDLEVKSTPADEFLDVVTATQQHDEAGLTPTVTRADPSRNGATMQKSSKFTSATQRTSSSRSSKRKLVLSSPNVQRSEVEHSDEEIEEVQSTESSNDEIVDPDQDDPQHQLEEEDDNRNSFVNNGYEDDADEDQQELDTRSDRTRSLSRSSTRKNQIPNYRDRDSDTESEEEEEEEESDDEKNEVSQGDHQPIRKRGRSSPALENPPQKARRLLDSMVKVKTNAEFGKLWNTFGDLFSKSNDHEKTLIRNEYKKGNR